MQFNDAVFCELFGKTELARQLIRHFGGLAQIFRAPPEVLGMYPNVTPRDVRLITGLAALARQQSVMKKGLPKVRHAEGAVTLLAPHYLGCRETVFSILLLNAQHYCVGIRVLSNGLNPTHSSWTSTVLRHAVKANAKGIVVAANSELPRISTQEQKACRALRAAAAILDIELIDYIKFGRVGWRSLANVYLHPQNPWGHASNP